MSRWILWAVLMCVIIPAPQAGGGQALLALSPAPTAGVFDVEAYLLDPNGWASQADDHAHGWSVAYRAQAAPAGWNRPFLMRGGGRAAQAGAFHPRYHCAVAEMLPARRTALLALRDELEPDACHPGQPNPAPFYRDGWLFAHDGRLDIAAMTVGIWTADWGASWDDFRALYPRDFNGNADSTRGNAGEIYLLTLLYDLELAGGDLETAVRRTLFRITSLPGAESWRLNAILQGEDLTCAIRYTAAGGGQEALYWGLTTDGEYAILDSLPPEGEWTEIPNQTLAFFPAGAVPELRPIEFSTLPESPPLERLSLKVLASPAVGRVAFALTVPALGVLELWDLEGRMVGRLAVSPGSSQLTWQPPAGTGSGLLFARLRVGTRERCARLLLLR